MPYPDFLCIGAQKSGTTWLHHQLEKHPETWLPPIKELHYFDRPNDKRLIYNVVSFDTRGKSVRSRLKLLFKKGQAAWVAHLLLRKRDDKYYKGLFRPNSGQISGEITPAYAWLDSDTIVRIHQLMPESKLIYLLRYPVDRVWSQMNMYRRRPHVKNGVSDEEVMAIKERMLFEHTRYTEHIKRWTSHFDRSQLFVGFFDQIKESPGQLIHDIFEFIGVDPDYGSPELEKNLKSPRNQGDHGAIPPELERTLTQQLLPEIEALHRQFGNEYTEKWLERATLVLSKTPQF